MTDSSGLVLDIDFAEKSGAVAGDASRYGNDGALTGCKWVEHGLEFNGSSDYVDCGNDSILNPGTSDFSFGAWAKTTATSGYILTKATGENRFFLGMDALGVIKFQLKDAALNSVLIVTDNAYNDNNWHHVMITIDRDVADGAKIYVDGAERKTGNPTAVGNVNPTGDLWIGSYTGGAVYYNGSIDAVRIYNHALNASEIKAYYDSTKHRYK